jgi:hypothetical protein
MRRGTSIALLFCGFCLVEAGCTAAEKPSPNTTATVTPEERASSDMQGQQAQGEPAGEVQERAVPGMVVPAVPVPGRVAPIPGPVVPAEAPVDWAYLRSEPQGKPSSPRSGAVAEPPMRFAPI